MSWTNAAVTEAGLALQAKLVDGQTLGFLRVAAGTGTVDSSVLANQTALVNEKQTLTFQPPNVLDGAKIKVPVMLNNIGLETGYTMQQLGFFADDPDDGEILYAIVQDEVGDTVPSQAESPGFVIDWAFVFQFGNASEVTVTLDPVGLVSIDMVGQPNGVAGLDENGTVPIEQGGTGATSAQDAVVALGALFAVAAAAEYDPEGSYAVGDYCTHGGGLHKCNTPIPSGEAWNAEHWTKTTIANELAGKSNAVPPQEADLTLSSGIGGSAKYFKTQENVGFVFGWITGAQIDKTVATLPVGYLPKFNTIVTSSASSNDDTNNSVRFRFNTDGRITVEKADDPTALQNGMALVGWYLVSE